MYKFKKGHHTLPSLYLDTYYKLRSVRSPEVPTNTTEEAPSTQLFLFLFILFFYVRLTKSEGESLTWGNRPSSFGHWLTPFSKAVNICSPDSRSKRTSKSIGHCLTLNCVWWCFVQNYIFTRLQKQPSNQSSKHRAVRAASFKTMVNISIYRPVISSKTKASGMGKIDTRSYKMHHSKKNKKIKK